MLSNYPSDDKIIIPIDKKVDQEFTGTWQPSQQHDNTVSCLQVI